MTTARKAGASILLAAHAGRDSPWCPSGESGSPYGAQVLSERRVDVSVLTGLSNVVAYACRASHSKDRRHGHSLPGFDGITPRQAASAQSTDRNRATRAR